MGAGRRRFSREFKLEAVRLVEQGRRVSEVAADLGISRTVLQRWRRQVDAGGERAFPGHGRVRPENEELVALRRELKRVREERDILKKALAFFAERKA
jgi:transposase